MQLAKFGILGKMWYSCVNFSFLVIEIFEAFDGFWWLLYLGLCMAMCVLLISSPHSPADFPHCQVSPTGQPLERRIANRWMPSTGIWHSAGASRCFKNCRNPKICFTKTDRLFRPSPHVLPHLSRFQSKLHCILIIQVLSRSKIRNSWKLVVQNGLKRFKLKI